MDIWFDVDAALAEVPVNIIPLVSSTDYITINETLTGTTDCGINLNWNFVNTAGAMSQTFVQPTTDGNYLWTHLGNGMYTIYIPASGGGSINNDAEGFGWFTGVATGVLPWRSPVFGFRASGLNDKLIDSAYSATRGLSGTALPDAAANAAGGLPISTLGGLDLDTQIGTDIDAILEDTGTDGVVVASLATDSITAAALKADAVTEIQNGLATAAALTTIDDFLDTEVAAILADTNELQTDLTNGGRLDMLIDAIKAKTDNLPADPADDSDIDAQLAAIKAETALIVEDTATTIPATLATIEGKIDTADTVVDAIKAKTDNLPTDPADDSDIDTAIAAVKTVVDAILVDTGTTLDGKITAILADTNELQAELADGGRTDLLIDAILEDTGTTIPGTITTIDNEVAVIDGIVDAILADTNELQTDLTDGGRLDLLIDAIKTETDSQATAAEVWAYTPRTLTNAGTTITNPADGDPLYIYNNQTVIIELTDLGSVAALTAAGDKVWFTIKENLDDPDTNAILHIITTAPGDLDNDASTLTWVNGAAPISATGGVLAFTDVTAGDVTITLDAAEAANMPIYAVTPVYWDIKSLDYSSGVVTILQTGTAYIYNSSTKTIA